MLLLFLLFGLGYSYYTPLWNPPDEERHFAYCEYIAHHHKLPDYVKDPKGNSVTMAFHPPLYYLMGSLFFGNDRGLLEELISANDEREIAEKLANRIRNPGKLATMAAAAPGEIRSRYAKEKIDIETLNAYHQLIREI